MNKRDQKLIELTDIPAALGLLTRLPIPVSQGRAVARGAAAAWAYPLAGTTTGLPIVLTGFGAVGTARAGLKS